MNVNPYISPLLEQDSVAQMQNSVRKWTLVFFIFTGISVLVIHFIFAEKVDLPWFALLLMVIVLAWFTRVPAMFIIFSMLLGWSALMNIIYILSDPNQLRWLAIAAVKVLFAMILIRQYSKYRHLHAQDEANVLVSFGKGSAILSFLCLIIPLVTCMGLITYIGFTEDVNSDTLSPQAEQLTEIFFTSVIILADMAVFALGLGIATTTVKDYPKGWASAGIVMSTIVIVGYIGFLLLAESLLFIEQQGVLPAGG